MRLATLSRIVVELVGDLVAPLRCAACDEVLPSRALFCAGCSVTVEAADASSGAAFAYGGAITSAIVRLKYAGRADLAGRLGIALAASKAARALEGRVDLVVPVPMHARRLAERGYNHAALMSRAVARCLEIRHAARALERVRDTPRQAALDAAARHSNVRGAFVCADARTVRGRAILLVDDVRTTGATLAACTAALSNGGAASVAYAVLAAARDDGLHDDR